MKASDYTTDTWKQYYFSYNDNNGNKRTKDDDKKHYLTPTI